MKLINKLATAGAVAAMGLGMGAASASAAGINLDPNPYSFSGSQTTTNSFTAGGATVTCSTATFTGNTSNSTNLRIPFRANYSGCHVNFAGILVPATVTTHSDWALNYVSGSAGTSVTSTVDVTDPGGGVTPVTIQVPAIGCTIGIYPQTGLSHVVATNVASPTAVDLAATVTGISYHATSGCAGVPATGTNGTYNGSVRISGITMTDA